jgi:uncharacterized Tic20 family protein
VTIPPEDPVPPAVDEPEAEPYEPASETGPVYEAGKPSGGDHTFGILCHVASHPCLLGYVLLHVLAPLGIWYFLKRDDPEVEHHAKEAFNFQVNALLWGSVGGVMTITCILAPIGLPLAFAALVLSIVMPIVAAIKTANGERYRYPLTYRFLV